MELVPSGFYWFWCSRTPRPGLGRAGPWPFVSKNMQKAGTVSIFAKKCQNVYTVSILYKKHPKVQKRLHCQHFLPKSAKTLVLSALYAKKCQHFQQKTTKSVKTLALSAFLLKSAKTLVLSAFSIKNTQKCHNACTVSTFCKKVQKRLHCQHFL